MAENKGGQESFSKGSRPSRSSEGARPRAITGSGSGPAKPGSGKPPAGSSGISRPKKS